VKGAVLIRGQRTGSNTIRTRHREAYPVRERRSVRPLPSLTSISSLTPHSMIHSLAWAVSEMQGWRLTMEDAHAGILELGERDGEGKKTSFFAVYDGHGGASFFPPLLSCDLAVLDGVEEGRVADWFFFLPLSNTLPFAISRRPPPSPRATTSTTSCYFRLHRREIRRRHGPPPLGGQRGVQEARLGGGDEAGVLGDGRGFEG
jgi:hypothetical protein